MNYSRAWLAILVSLTIGCPLILNSSIAISPALAQLNNSNRQAAEKLNQEGLNLAEQGDFPAALVKYQQALAVYKSVGDRLNEGTVLGNICLANYYRGQIDLALDICQQSLRIAQDLRDRQGMVTNFNSIALIYQSTGKYPQAIDYFQQTLVIVRELKDRKSEGTILYNIGFVYNSQAKYSQALELYEQALEISKAVGDRSGEGLVLSAIGLVYQVKGEYRRALELFQQAEKIAQEIKDRVGLGVALGNIGQTYVYLADYQQAIKYFERSIKIFRSLNYLAQVGINLNNQGNTYNFIGQYSKALIAFEKALEIYRSTHNRAEEATTLLNIGKVYQFLGQYPRSLKYYQSVLEIAQNLGNKNIEGIVTSSIGGIYNQLQQYGEAQKYHERALLIHQATGNQLEISTTLNNLAADYSGLQQYDRALTTRIQALKIKEKIGDRAGMAQILNNIGNDYSWLGEVEKSLSYYRNATEIAHQINYREIESIALTNQGRALYKLDRLAAAEVPLHSAIEIWESLRSGLIDKDKISLQDRIKSTYDLLQKVLIEQNKTQAALEIAERGRARVLAELLASKVTTINSAASQKIRQAPNLSKIQQIARAQKATLVEYSTIDDRILIWVIKPTGQITFHQTKLPPKTTLKDLVVATRDGIGANRGRRSKDDTSNPTGGDLKQLHQLLIAPIVKDLPTKPEDRVIILPQNELFLVPFAALQDAQDRYLIQQHTITIAPSIQVLALTETKSDRLSKTPPLVVGNPIMPLFGGTQLANLPGSEAEAKGIGTILKVAPLIGAQADKQQVIALMKTAPIVHLATHGLLDTIKGDIPGAIALTNGFLTSGEIFDMQLSANLVVLSACDTGRGDLTGEGVVGLSRSLSVAGVPSVIVSLWEVNDEATKALMEEFYRNLQLKKLSKAQALRQAMLTTMVDYPNPNFWSAFMLVGAGN
jgi:CHAT domain-containing protein